MKPYKLITATLLMLGFSNPSVADTNVKELFNGLCASCHATSGKATVAPPLVAVVNHVKSAHPEKEAFVDYLVNWVANPQAEKALMPGAVKKFGVMPTLPYEAEKVRLIAEYLFDGNPTLPAWYIEHYKEEHGEAPKNK